MTITSDTPVAIINGRAIMPSDLLTRDQLARMADRNSRSTARLWAAIARDRSMGPRVPVLRIETEHMVFQTNGRDSSRTRKATAIPLRETAKPSNQRRTPPVPWELIGWALLFLSLGVVVGVLLGVTR